MSEDPICVPPVSLQSSPRTPRYPPPASHKPGNGCANILQQNRSMVVSKSADEPQSDGCYSGPAASRSIGEPENEIRRLQLPIDSALFGHRPSPLTDRALLSAIAS